ncbi:hypothetical protein VTN96DRAFT_3760 [Rasamsonia emersonii]
MVLALAFRVPFDIRPILSAFDYWHIQRRLKWYLEYCHAPEQEKGKHPPVSTPARLDRVHASPPGLAMTPSVYSSEMASDVQIPPPEPWVSCTPKRECGTPTGGRIASDKNRPRREDVIAVQWEPFCRGR